MVPRILHLLGHQVRWKIADQLSRSDLKVSELALAAGEAQNLVSYHLRLLRDAGIVRERRSSADGRDVYYSLDRHVVASGLRGALASLSPEAGGAAPSGAGRPRTGRVWSVLFLCTGNSARSQIAEAILRNVGGRRVRVRSAGAHPVGVHPRVFEVLKSRRVRPGHLRSKPVEEFAGQAFDYVVTLCDIARSEPIQVRGRPRRVHWSIPDPVSTQGGEAAVARAFAVAADEIEDRVGEFYGSLLAQEALA